MTIIDTISGENLLVGPHGHESVTISVRCPRFGRISRRGEEVARLVPAHSPGGRRLGIDRDRYVVPDEFDAPLPDDVLAAFER